eukprot:scaffold91012_cov40-Cyclotella_meneghiniana.AAC.1
MLTQSRRMSYSHRPAGANGRYDHLVTAALNNNGNNKNEGSKVTAKTQGMDQVLSSIQIGSTAPFIFTNNNSSNNNHEQIPHNDEEMQQLLSRTGSASEITVLSTIRYRIRSRMRHGYISRRWIVALSLRDAVRHCDMSDGAPTVAHVCKFASVPRLSVTDSGLPPISVDAKDAGSIYMIMGIARISSGTLRAEMSSTKPLDHGMSGKKAVDAVPAGHIAVYNLEQLQLKTEDYTAYWGLNRNQMKAVKDSKLLLELASLFHWPKFASYEEDLALRDNTKWSRYNGTRPMSQRCNSVILTPRELHTSTTMARTAGKEVLLFNYVDGL